MPTLVYKISCEIDIDAESPSYAEEVLDKIRELGTITDLSVRVEEDPEPREDIEAQTYKKRK